ncbi:MAG: bifunctional 3'-5' exonuclease/DNA polymerase, partial [Actinomycetota bacterium]|nr:bifunctional 3'-5' exonuclease/DNA polymerase [Actinomycetota bacterium]
MPVLVVPDAEGGRLLPFSGSTVGERSVDSLATALAEDPVTRWVWSDTAAAYPPVLAAGTRVARCHDLALTEALLLGYDGRWGEPASVAAAWARLRGLPVPADQPPAEADERLTLFGPAPVRLPAGTDPMQVAAAV